VTTDTRPAGVLSGQPRRGPAVVDLLSGQACDPALTGAKAAALAMAAAASLPVVPGFVVTTAATDRISGSADLPDEVVAAWRELSRDGTVPLVVRSSSTVEDLGDSSMAGRFESVVGVRGEQEFAAAVQAVIASRESACGGSDALSGDEPIAVLVQPLLDARCGGVLFGIDPVSGREDRLVVAAVEDGPDRLVSGAVDGSRYALETDGSCVESEHADGGVRLRRGELVQLAGLAARTAEVFGGPQDVEWAFDERCQLRLLQSRPVTATPRGVPDGPVLGTGPVAETFPEPLRCLEVDLWVPPLEAALGAALRLAGTAAAEAIEQSPIVKVVGGRVAVDLDLLEPGESRTGALARLDPRPRVRRLRASWRVGRLRAALPALARDVVDSADLALAAVPPFADLTDRQLVALLQRSRPALTSVHAHEVLIGLLADATSRGLTGVSTALRVLARARAAGTPDAEVVAANPVVLALIPPGIGRALELPADVVEPELPPAGTGDEVAALREALRLRARWLQEVTARAAGELGRRLAEGGRLPSAAAVADVPVGELAAAVRDPAVVLTPQAAGPGEPLPARFRLGSKGLPIAVGATGSATGAGGGRGVGVVHQGNDPPEGCVLVVRNLDPSLASYLPRLAGLVAETGSVLAHLAILARESGVPTVVGYADATEKLPAGTRVEVDGDEGRVEHVEEER
jgi:phosphohistidine swiveling domain-containing protein